MGTKTQKQQIKERLKELTGTLPITGCGYEELNFQTPIMGVEDFLLYLDPYGYSCECLIILDGRIIPAEPGHQMVLLSLINFLEKKETDYSAIWFFEELLLLSQAVVVYNNFQKTYYPPNEEQLKILKALEAAEKISIDIETYVDSRSRDYFIRESKIAQERIEI